MARSVADAAALLTVLAGYDPADPATAPLRTQKPIDYSAVLDPHGLKGARIGVLRQYAGFHEEVDGVFEKALDTLRAQGAVVVDNVEIPNQGKLDADETTVLLYEFKDGINRYLAARVGTGPRTLADLIDFDLREAAREMPYFRQELFTDAQAKAGLTDPEYIATRDRVKRLAGPEGIDAALAKDKLDALVAPTLGAAWTTDLVNGDHFLGGGVSTPAAVAGYPHITVPMGAVHGLPVGLSVIGPAWSESRLIRYAYAYEQASAARRPPEFHTTVAGE
jgi:amidase